MCYLWQRLKGQVVSVLIENLPAIFIRQQQWPAPSEDCPDCLLKSLQEDVLSNIVQQLHIV